MTTQIENRFPPAAPAPGDGGNGKTALMEVDHLKVLFPVKAGLVIDRTVAHVHAVDDVSFVITEGETLGVVGESGCGKTTLIRTLVRLVPSTGGQIRYRGTDITKAGRGQMEPIRREMQMVFQDPQASLNPRKRVRQILETPLKLRGVSGAQVEAESRTLMDRVGLRPEHLGRFPHEFSGGQRQRIGIARALAVNPKLILLDEPVSALDVSIQAQMINLLDELQDEFGLSYVFVAHDLSVVRHVSDRIVVMYLGKVMELSPAEELYTKPIHPYTSALLGAIPIPDPKQNRERERAVISGEVPSPIDPPAGCRFAGRCPRATEICRAVEPQLTEYAGGHLAACHHPQNVTAQELAAATRSPLSPVGSGPEMPSLD
ncbi:MAG TPA: oligopeptide/dipeptide ABC transporter ATP-binding protein [Solirubrobacteraceae bacterium]|nr:oligopeptide/dipeptide ABC transporter ATP-binding protein [Solirubrobacteraceae bacterium]